MRKLALALAFPALFLAACAGGSSRYGCPVEEGYSCKSVSEVYGETAWGGAKETGPFPESRGGGKSACARAGRKFLKGGALRAGKAACDREDVREAAQTEEALPVYVHPPAIRLWIAPWQDARGVFHSQKYVYVIAGAGRWTIGGKEVPLGEVSEERPGEMRLRGAGRNP